MAAVRELWSGRAQREALMFPLEAFRARGGFPLHEVQFKG